MLMPSGNHLCAHAHSEGGFDKRGDSANFVLYLIKYRLALSRLTHFAVFHRIRTNIRDLSTVEFPLPNIPCRHKSNHWSLFTTGGLINCFELVFKTEQCKNTFANGAIWHAILMMGVCVHACFNFRGTFNYLVK